MKVLQKLQRLLLLVLLIFVLSNKAALSAEYYTNRYAVVVGISHYAYADWQTLSYARKDAESVAALLKQMGYTVFPLYDQEATRQRIISTLEDELAPRLGPKDAVLFFFAGHGTTKPLGQEDWGYLVPADGTNQSASLISMDELQTLSRKMGNAKHQAFIMDCCYGGMLGRKRSGGGGIPINVPSYLQEVSQRKARQILTAGGKDQSVSDSGPGGHSIFTGYLLKAIQEGQADINRDGWVSFNELATYTLQAATTPTQTPGSDVLHGHEQGEFLFQVPKRAATPTRGSASNESQPALRTSPKYELSIRAVQSLITRRSYYDRDWNKDGAGYENNFEKKQIGTALVVFDAATGLMWEQSGSPSYMTLEEAGGYIKGLNAGQFAGFQDWRLPTVDEAMSLLESEKKNGDLFIDPIFDSEQGWIWTGDKEKPEQAWTVNFSHGICRYRATNGNFYVRAVRVAQ